MSTCYVVGMRDGRVDEDLEDNYNPKHDKDFRRRRRNRIVARNDSQCRRSLAKPGTDEGFAAASAGPRRRCVKSAGGGTRRRSEAQPRALGEKSADARWPAPRAASRLAEHLHVYEEPRRIRSCRGDGKDLAIAVVRPSIVESSTRSPFPGWNEGINTSGPLSYLLGTNFRQLPTNARKCLDVIPVDMVCRGMSLIAAAVIARKNARMYQLATSAVNPVNMGRSIELTGLAHRKYYKRQPGIDPWLKVKFETIPVSKQRYERMSIPMQKAVVSRINRAATTLHMKKGPLARQERDLGRAEKLIELYEPFILHNEHVFECENARLLSAALPPDEKFAFEFDPESIDWWNYWINIHIPALRRWCYPLMEGRPLESRTPREMDWSSQSQSAPARASAAGTSAPPADPLWRSS